MFGSSSSRLSLLFVLHQTKWISNDRPDASPSLLATARSSQPFRYQMNHLPVLRSRNQLNAQCPYTNRRGVGCRLVATTQQNCRQRMISAFRNVRTPNENVTTIDAINRQKKLTKGSTWTWRNWSGIAFDRKKCEKLKCFKMVLRIYKMTYAYDRFLALAASFRIFLDVAIRADGISFAFVECYGCDWFLAHVAHEMLWMPRFAQRRQCLSMRMRRRRSRKRISDDYYYIAICYRH